MKKELENCWEFFDCPKERTRKCPAYKNDVGKKCYLIASTFCLKIFKDKFNYCWECPWFKKINPNFNGSDLKKLKEKQKN